MSRKVIKAKSNQNSRVTTYSFKTFSKVEKGVKSYSFKKLYTESEQVSNINQTPHEKKSAKASVDLVNAEEVKIAEKKGYDKGFQEGYKKGKDETEKLLKSRYEAEKNDYLDLLKKNFQSALNEIEEVKKHFQELDENLPDLIVKFVTEIIGVERKINDGIIKSIINNILSKIKTYTDVTFIVSPADKKILEEMNLGYNIETDPNLHKGDLRVKTNIGAIDFSIDNLIEEFKERLYEEFESSKEN